MKKAKKLWFALGVALSVIALVCACYLVWRYVEWRSAETLGEELRTSFAPSLSPSPSPSAAEPVESPEPSAEPVEIPVDFAGLREVNPDIYAWIRIPGTGVDGPVLRSEEDDEYYMSHSADGEYSAYGALFTQPDNAMDFTDFDTIIYGHKTGAMFGELLWYADREFFDEHRTIYVYTPEKIFTYRVFAAYVYGTAHILRSLDFSEETVRNAYIRSMFAVRDMSSCIDMEAQVGTDDRLLTLSTCTSNSWTSRFLVQGVLIEEQG